MRAFDIMFTSAITVVLGSPAMAQVAPSANPAPMAEPEWPADDAPQADAATASPMTGSADAFEGDIVVTARRINERLQDVPLAVSAVTGATLQRQGVSELVDLNATVPSLKVAGAGSGGGIVVFTIRGQSQANQGLLYVDPAVGVYVDGLNVPRNTGLRSGLVDIQRVEVLRGPQGTLYGRNTTGGAIAIITEDPKPEIGASIQGTYGNYDTWNLTGILNLPVSDGIGLRFVAQHGEHDGYGNQIITTPTAGGFVINGRGAPLYEEENTYLRGKLKIDRGPLQVSVTGDYFEYNGSPQARHLAGLVPADPNNAVISGRICVPLAGLTGADPARVGTTACTPTGGAAGSGRFYGVAGGNATNGVRQALFGSSLAALTAGNLDVAAATLQSYVRTGNDRPGVSFYDSYGLSNAVYAGSPPRGRDLAASRGGSIVLNLDYELSETLAVRSISGWRNHSRSDFLELDGTPFIFVDARNGTPYADIYTQELQLLGNTDRLRWVAGGYYSYEKGLDFTTSASLQPILAGGVNDGRFGIADGVTTNISKAVFAQASYEITSDLTATFGGRYTQEIRKIRNRNRNSRDICGIPPSLLNDPDGPIQTLATTPASQGPCGANLSASFSKPSWLVSLDYKINPDVLAYVKLANGFRGGGQQGRANTANNAASFIPFEPETVTEYEVGLKSDFFDRRLRLNLAAFYDDYSNVQRTITLVSTAGSYSLVSNAASARLWGVEAEANVVVTPTFTLSGNVGYLNAKYKDFQDAILGDRTDEPFLAPEWNYSISARYEQPTAFGAARGNLQWVYTGSQNLQPQGLARAQNVQEGYGLLNATLGLHFEQAGIEVSAFARNILEKEYYASGTSLETLGVNTLIVGEPRTFGVQLTKTFGSEN